MPDGGLPFAEETGRGGGLAQPQRVGHLAAGRRHPVEARAPVVAAPCRHHGTGAQAEFAIGRRLRDRILGFPARVANLVPPEAMTSLTEECEALVRELQDEVASIAVDGRA